jgi:SAM-dependent methyltransferase
MTGSRINAQLRRMRRDWDRRARENARFYVATLQDQWSDDEFYRSGDATFEEQILTDLGNICQGKDPHRIEVLEIGCGAGRVTRALARHFGQIYAVDISAEMLRQARRGLAEFPNVRIFRNNGRDLSGVGPTWWSRWGIGRKLRLDFAFSCMVFQHISNREIIESYIRDVNRVLRPGALFKFQVQGSPRVTAEADDTWVGASYSESEAREMAVRCGFEMRYHTGAGTQYYWLWFFKEREIE